MTISVDWLQIESLSIRTPGSPDGTGQPSTVEIGPIAYEIPDQRRDQI
ncbi:MAG: hypothetical protein R3F24_14885 [Gammaproteobacteria bacterium]